MLPKPLCTFKIPSLHDGLELDGRLYFPKLASNVHSTTFKGFAIFAHPYAFLGGSWDDPVVCSVGALLLSKGFVLNTFNFRGARGAQGRTSWTGKPELGDYVSFYALMLAMMTIARDEMHVSTSTDFFERPLLVLGGYSYGSHIASHLPPHEAIAYMMANRPEGSWTHDIRARAVELAKSFAGYLELHALRGRTDSCETGLSSPARSIRGVVVGGYDSNSSGRRSSRESLRRSTDAGMVRKSIDRVKRRISFSSRENSQSSTSVISEAPEKITAFSPRIAYILVSPLLPPISGLTTMFSDLKFDPNRAAKSSSGNGKSTEMAVDTKEMLTQNPTCAVYGSNDKFTSSKKLRHWATELRVQNKSAFVAHEVHNAGHFWVEPGAETSLLNAIGGWIAGLIESP